MSMGKITRSKTYNELRHREISNKPPRGRPPRRGVIDLDVIPPNERRQERPLPEIRLPMPPETRLNEPRLNEPRVNIPPRDVPSASRPGDSQDPNSQDQMNNLPPGSSTTTTSTVITIKMTTVTHTDANNNSTTTTTVTTDISPVTSNTVSSDPATVTVETSEMPPQISRFPTQITPIIASNNNNNSNGNDSNNVSSNVSNNNNNSNSDDKEKEVNATNVSKTASSNQNQTNSVSSPPSINPTPNTATFPGQLNASQLQQQMAAVYAPQIASVINNVASNMGVGSEVNAEDVFSPHFTNNNVTKHTSSYNPPMNSSMSNGNVIHPHPPITPNHAPNFHNNPIVGTYNHPPMVQNYPIIPINGGADSGGMFPHRASSSSNNNFMNIPSHGVNALDANHQASAIVRTPSTTTINSNGTIPSPIDSVNGPPISFAPPVHNSDNSSANSYAANRMNPPPSIAPENTRPRPKYYRLPELDSLDTVYDVWNEWNVGLNGNPSVITLLETYGNKWASENKDPLIARKKIIKEIQIRINDVEIDEVINEMERMRDGRGLTWLAKKFGKKRAPTHRGG